MEQLASLLAALGREPDEQIALLDREQTDDALVRYQGHYSVAEAPDIADGLNGDIYYTVLPRDPDAKYNGQGGKRTVTKIDVLYVDLDSKDDGLGSEAGCRAFTDRLSEVLCEKPCAIVPTGTGGLHVYWRLSEPVTEPLLKAWAQLVRAEATKFGGSVDYSVSGDPARILRVPGSVRADGAHVGLEANVAARPVDVREFTNLVSSYLVLTDKYSAGEVAFETWQPAAETCGYVRSMIEGWQTESNEHTKNRHGWMLTQFHRLMAAARLGCVSAEDFQLGEQAIVERFSYLRATQQPIREIARYEIQDAINSARQETSRKSEAYLREQELGGHTCMSAQGEVKEAGSWQRKNLREALKNPDARPKPALWEREDGIFLLYPGCTHSVHGESESGKSLVMQWETARLLKQGASVLYLDYEDTEWGVGERLELMGVTLDHMDNLYYINPEQDYGSSAEDRADFEALLELPFSLCVIDGVTEAMQQAPPVVEKTGGGNDAAVAWQKRLPRLIASKTRAAVVVIDHVSKGNDGRTAIGGQSKMSGLSGSAFVVTPVEALGRGLIGRLKIEVGKDRPGYVRGYAVGKLGENRLQQIATIEVDGTNDQLSVRTMVPQEEPDKRALNAELDEGARLRKISAYLQELPDGASANTIRKAINVGRDATNAACKQLEEGGYIEKVGSGPKTRYVHAKPFNANVGGALSFLIED